LLQRVAGAEDVLTSIQESIQSLRNQLDAHAEQIQQQQQKREQEREFTEAKPVTGPETTPVSIEKLSAEWEERIQTLQQQLESLRASMTLPSSLSIAESFAQLEKRVEEQVCDSVLICLYSSIL